MSRCFTLTAETKSGKRITPNESKKIAQALSEFRTGGWEGSLENGWMICLDASWYDFYEDMHTIAMDNPNVVFTLFCMGETLDDIWEAGFCGERYDFREAIIPDLDMKFLKGDE